LDRIRPDVGRLGSGPGPAGPHGRGADRGTQTGRPAARSAPGRRRSLAGFELNAIAAFWFAYVVTRPLGASFADYLGRPHSLSGANLGSGRIAVIVAAIVAVLVAYLAVTRHDIQPPANHKADPQLSPSLAPGAPGTSPRRGF
jgi:hypothetical protein